MNPPAPRSRTTTRSARQRSRVATVLIATLATLATIVPVAITATPVAAATLATADFAGRGYGHGRGLSQYGAYGYARDRSWSTDQILDHYYGGTTASTVAQAGGISIDPNYLRVRLMGLDNQTLMMFSTSGASTLSLTGAGAIAIPAEAKAVRMVKLDQTWQIDTAPACAGPWTPLGPSVGDTVTVGRSSGNDDLFVCRPDGSNAFYPGSLRAQIVGSGTRGVNITTIEEYLRGVIPREMPASWHAAALRAQTIAARSYAMAGDTRHTPYADTCDTTLCQVYKGRFEQPAGGQKTATTSPNTDTAIAETTGVVRAFTKDGRIARTEFSSTSGGWTANGTFPAVEDLGDSISPVHTWTVKNVSLAPLNSLGTGNLTKLSVTKRNGLGADGGRVTEVRLDFDGQTSPVLVSGDTVRSKLGLRSDWFTVSVSDCTGTDVGEYVDAVFQLFVDRPATNRDQIDWCDKVVQEGRLRLTRALSVSDEWAGVQIDGLYRKILGRSADAGGRANWLRAVEGGMRLEDIAAGFYGSAEYLKRAGGTTGGYVDRLYVDLLGRPSDPGGRATWTREIDARRLSRRQVAEEFYRSVESRRDRVTTLYQTILGRNPEPGGLEHWKQQLTTIGDIVLAAELAGSLEYYRRVTA